MVMRCTSDMTAVYAKLSTSLAMTRCYATIAGLLVIFATQFKLKHNGQTDGQIK